MRTNVRQQWKDVFDAVIEHYQEVKSSNSHLGALNYEEAGVGTGSGRCTKIVRPSNCDFICDVERAARRALRDNDEELAFFQTHYSGFSTKRPGIYTTKDAQIKAVLDESYLPPLDPTKGGLNDSVREKVGKILMARRIYPVSRYFASRDVR